MAYKGLNVLLCDTYENSYVEVTVAATDFVHLAYRSILINYPLGNGFQFHRPVRYRYLRWRSWRFIYALIRAVVGRVRCFGHGILIF